LIGIPRSKLITIKQDTLEQSKIRGYLFDFELTALPEIHHLILSCGAGEKNSLGFGWVEVYNQTDISARPVSV
jgi:CRISPR-associated endoribonuclease Cas6